MEFINVHEVTECGLRLSREAIGDPEEPLQPAIQSGKIFPNIIIATCLINFVITSKNLFDFAACSDEQWSHVVEDRCHRIMGGDRCHRRSLTRSSGTPSLPIYRSRIGLVLVLCEIGHIVIS